ncbi:Uncharacterised protein [Bordetella pertussis]|nr:Uncharacterised protein [Bordetella pertussis]CFW48079.1 Uncharacterised protein [Bordetella pertussis]
MREQAQDGQRGELEIGQRDIAARGLDRLELLHQRRVAGDFAVDAGTFVEIDEMGRGVQAHPVARGQQDGFEHGAGRPLAVGAAHHEIDPVQAQIEPAGHLPHPVQPQVYGLGVDGFQILQPGRQVCAGVGAGGGHGDEGKSKQGAV